MTTATIDGHRTIDVCRRLGVSYRSLNYWVARWYTPGGGGRVRLTDPDVMILRAIFALTGNRKGSTGPSRRLIEAIENAIRAEPRRWLVLAGDTAATHDTFEQAVTAAAAVRWPVMGRLIDLDPEAT